MSAGIDNVGNSPSTRADGVPELIDSTPVRAYQRIAQALTLEIESGFYPVGSRLPSERELSSRFNVSRPTLREALTVLEAQGQIEIRGGSGTTVLKVPGGSADYESAVSELEIIEARLHFAGEAAALAAAHISAVEISTLKNLITQIIDSAFDNERLESASRKFYVVIAHATRNAVIASTIISLWRLRSISAECIPRSSKEQSSQSQQRIKEYRTIVVALENNDVQGSRVAMRAHLSAVMDRMLLTTELEEVRKIKHAAAITRERYSKTRAYQEL